MSLVSPKLDRPVSMKLFRLLIVRLTKTDTAHLRSADEHAVGRWSLGLILVGGILSLYFLQILLYRDTHRA